LNTLVTVVTPCYNSAEHIEDTIKSVLSQTYPYIEYIVMDAQSTDATADIVRQYADRLTFVSEPDTGQANAINKGWKMARGEILAWLNADDLYLSNTVQTAVDYLAQYSEAGWLYGNAQFLNSEGNPFPFRNPVFKWDYDLLLNSNIFITQPSVFLRRGVIERFGYLREDLYFGMDYEYWLRIGRDYPGYYVPSLQVQVKWHRDTKSASGGKKRIFELYEIVKQYGATEFPKIMRYEWEDAFIEDLLRQIRRGNWSEIKVDLKSLVRYPVFIPRAILKNLMRFLLTPKTETHLRQWMARLRLLQG
jgi:glycosyltransferase involved in cell wall biosynthesis